MLVGTPAAALTVKLAGEAVGPAMFADGGANVIPGCAARGVTVTLEFPKQEFGAIDAVKL